MIPQQTLAFLERLLQQDRALRELLRLVHVEAFEEQIGGLRDLLARLGVHFLQRIQLDEVQAGVGDHPGGIGCLKAHIQQLLPEFARAFQSSLLLPPLGTAPEDIDQRTERLSRGGVFVAERRTADLPRLFMVADGQREIALPIIEPGKVEEGMPGFGMFVTEGALPGGDGVLEERSCLGQFTALLPEPAGTGRLHVAVSRHSSLPSRRA